MPIYRRLMFAAIVCIALFAGAGTATSAVQSNDTFHFSFPVFNACAGESVLVDVDLHIVTTEVVGADGTVRARQNGNVRGWGVGLDSGAKYRFADNFHFSLVTTTGTASSQSSSSHTRLIGLGKTPNERLVYTFRQDIDEDGNVTTTLSDVSICQGN